MAEINGEIWFKLDRATTEGIQEINDVRTSIAAVRRSPEVRPLIIILTDGAGNISVTGMPPQEEALRMANMIHDSHLRTVVINMEHPAFDRGLAQQLADAVGGPCYTLPELKADALVRTVRQELSSKAGEPQTAAPLQDDRARLPDVPGAVAGGFRP